MPLRSQYGGALVALAAVLTIASPSLAQSKQSDAPIAPPTPAQAADDTSGFNKFSDDTSLGSDAKWLFGIGYEDKTIEKRALKFETFYLDTLRQYNDDNPTMRTQDLPSPYTTSVMSMEATPAPAASAPATYIPPASPDMAQTAPTEPAPVQGRW